MDVVVVLSGQRAVFEQQAAVIDACADGRCEPFADSEAVRWFQASEKVFTTERRTEKGGRASGNADKPVASPGRREHHSVKIDGLHRLKQLYGFVVNDRSYSVLLYGLYTCLCLQRAKHGEYKKDLFCHIPMIFIRYTSDL